MRAKNIWWLVLLMMIAPILFIAQPGLHAASDWAGWTNIGGQTGSAPSLIGYKNTLIAGIEGANNSPWLNINEGNWSDWFDLKNNSIADITMTNYKSDLIFFGRTTNNQVIFSDYPYGPKDLKKYPQALKWNEIANIQTPSAPAAVSYNDKMYVIFRGMNSKLYFTSGKMTYKSIAEIPGSGSSPSEPRAAVINNQIWTAVRGSDNGIYVNIMSSDNNWSGWKLVPGNGLTTSGPAIGEINGRVYLMVRGTDNGIYVNYLQGNSWNGWKSIGGQTSSGPCLVNYNNQLFAAIRGNDNRIYINSLIGGSSSNNDNNWNDSNNNNDNNNSWWDNLHHNKHSANDAKIISNTIPDTMIAGQSYTVSITLQNTGDNTWKSSKGYNLGAVGDSDPFAPNRIPLSSSAKIKSDDQITFTFTMTAPNSPGTYKTDWQMVQENVEWFGEKIAKNITVTKPHHWNSWNDPNSNNDNNFNGWWNDSNQNQTNDNNAKIISSDIPETMKPGQTYNVSVTVKNIGTTSWRSSKGYKLGAIGGSDSFTPARLELDSHDKINPGEQVTFSFTMTAPNSAGTFKIGWQMLQENVEWFGDRLVKNITVTKPHHWNGWNDPNSNNDNNFNGWWSDSNQDQTNDNNAKIISSDIPETMKPGQTYNVSVTVKNIGTTSWRSSKGYKLGAIGGSDSFAPARIELDSHDRVDPGEQVTFSFTMTAPNSAGTFKIGWQMLQENVEWFGDRLVKNISVTKPHHWNGWNDPNGNNDNNFNGWWSDSNQDQTNDNNAKTISSDIPETMKPGQTYNVSVTVKNIGTTSWRSNKGYKLGAIGGSGSFAPARIELDSHDRVDPGEQVTFSFTMTAPNSAGTFKIGWQMLQENVEWFGDRLVKNIKVIGATNNSNSNSNSGWSEVPGGGRTPSGPAASLFSNRLFVLVRGTDNGIYINSAAGGSWTGWSSIGGATPSQGALVNYNGSLYALVRGTDNAIYINRNSGGGFSGWAQVPGGGATPSGPAATVYNGKLYVVVRGTDNAVYVNTMDSGGSWSGWSSIGGTTPSEPSVSVYNGKLVVLVRGTNDGIFINQFNGGGWNGWSEIPGGGRTSSGPSVCTLNGGLYLVVQGTDNAIYINRLSGNDWQGWSQVPGGGRTPSGPSVVAFNGGLLILVQGTDNAIYQNQLSF